MKYSQALLVAFLGAATLIAAVPLSDAAEVEIYRRAATKTSLSTSTSVPAKKSQSHKNKKGSNHRLRQQCKKKNKSKKLAQKCAKLSARPTKAAVSGSPPLSTSTNVPNGAGAGPAGNATTTATDNVPIVTSVPVNGTATQGGAPSMTIATVPNDASVTSTAITARDLDDELYARELDAFIHARRGTPTDARKKAPQQKGKPRVNVGGAAAPVVTSTALDLRIDTSTDTADDNSVSTRDLDDDLSARELDDFIYARSIFDDARGAWGALKNTFSGAKPAVKSRDVLEEIDARDFFDIDELD
ncbi:hypothetical protein H0H81_005840 [Sphagnurus paluster]|uniref:Uncharacterized protein n=1 Tax=Sphagnurus paluster TaxID=117069 RepID=A0A9P7FRY8_9AGAR|nr:hypothetical protein H0H81_005840 [Sphagnurus paluster]